MSQPRKPLPMWPILREACLLVWDHRQHFGRLFVIPVVLTTLLSIAQSYWLEGKDLPIAVSLGSYYLPDLMVFTFFAISCHRSILMGEQSISRYGFSGWSMRETWFYLILIAIYIAAWIVAFLFGTLSVIAFALTTAPMQGILGQPIPFLENPELAISVLMTFATVPFAYIVGRSSLILPAIAIDLPPSFALGWLQSKGNGWRVTALVGGIPILFLVLQGLFGFALQWLTGISNTDGNQWHGVYTVVTSGWSALLQYMLATIEVAILSLTFKELSGWQPNEASATQAS